MSQIPAVDAQAIGMTFLAAVLRFYEDPENAKRFEGWLRRMPKDLKAGSGAEKKKEATHDRD